MTAELLQSRVQAGMRATAAAFPDIGARPAGWPDSAWRARGPFERASVRPLSASVGQRSRSLFLAVFAAAMVLVGLGALNSSGLMAARALARHRELAVRRALGATRLALARLVAIESLVLLGAAALIALPLSQPVLRLGLGLLPEDLVLLKPWAGEIFDWRVAGFAAAAALALVVPTSVWPMRRAVTIAPAAADAGNRTSERRTAGRFVVVAGQVAGAFVLTATGAFVVGSLLSVYAEPLPIRTDGVLSSRSTVTLFVDAMGHTGRVRREVLRELHAIEPPVSVRRANPLADVFADTVRPRRFRSWLFGSFAAAGLVVVGVGVLGLLAMSTAQRTKEVGVRQTLGATRSSIVRLLMREQIGAVAIGLVIGAVVSAWAVTFVQSYLYQVTTSDPRVWAAATILIVATAGLGALLPAVRASSTDPTTALRSE